jgi:hypothetical protein
VPVGSKQRAQIDFTAAATLKKWPSIRNQRAAASLSPYLVIEGTLDACIRSFLAKPACHCWSKWDPRPAGRNTLISFEKLLFQRGPDRRRSGPLSQH